MADYGIYSLLPPIIAIILAIVTKQVLISLFAGVFIGKLVLSGWAFFPALNDSMQSVIDVFQSQSNTKTIVFSFLVGAIITLIQVSGGVEGFVHFLTEKNKLIKNRKSAMLLTYFIGLVVFIESSINILTSGTVSRPVTDKYKVSREKLAFLCDSTCAPVCGIVPFNAWGATLMGLVGLQVTNGIISGNPTQIYFKSIPFNFYSIITLIAVPIYILSGKDWGPMKKAELRAQNEGKLMRDGATPLVSKEASEITTKEGVKPNMWNMILPLLVLILMIPIGLYITGKGVIYNGSGSTSVFWAVSASIVFSGILYISQKIMNLNEFIGYVYNGMGAMVSVILLLVFAFMIGTVSSDLHTGTYMANLVAGKINGGFGPAMVFIMSALIAFATGTSWGTFAIMMPISVQMGVAIDANIFACIGAVVSGALMGDHCSPISDTTILASMASASDHIDHVKTQLPYALLNGGIATALYIVVGFIG
ncbi:Na+/H+ antiporter NhaC family protein [Clostridium brassicae]|uniref:Sodium:proton antiporter n=1 Tax=Clostridium brassicae TaxID=2999072 RepID=A0ABT4DED1_9CLOT|nr:Na+/H+ antiporter NhaC family protein [Clostridium brassicae]MCY6960673.1 sodium:proton antiporter [Clostridium brassicae]